MIFDDECTMVSVQAVRKYYFKQLQCVDIKALCQLEVDHVNDICIAVEIVGYFLLRAI